MVSALEPVAASGDWSTRAGTLTWSCQGTAAHIVDCLFWYAANLARRSTTDAATPDISEELPAAQLVASIPSAAALLALAVDAADDDARGWHPFGIADRSGFAAMGCDEILVHGYDIATGLGVEDYAPPPDVAERTLRRLFPWADVDGDPWLALLRANGRSVGDQPRDPNWLWHCAPLAEWDGQPRRMPTR